MAIAEIARKALLTAVSSLAAFLVLEIGLRLWHGVKVLETSNFVLVPTDIFRANRWEVYDPLLGWRLPDYQAGIYFWGTITT